MTDINIPDEAVSAAHRAFYGRKPLGFREALAAGLAAWPGASTLQENDSASIREMACLILPLQEPRT
jgi:hypothetical protein